MISKCLVAITIFLLLFGISYAVQPSFLYNKDGSIREFGIGYKHKTVLPLWLYSILLGILSYLAVLYYVKYG